LCAFSHLCATRTDTRGKVAGRIVRASYGLAPPPPLIPVLLCSNGSVRNLHISPGRLSSCSSVYGTLDPEWPEYTCREHSKQGTAIGRNLAKATGVATSQGLEVTPAPLLDYSRPRLKLMTDSLWSSSRFCTSSYKFSAVSVSAIQIA
jgi:hypothetical protein